MTVVHIYPPMYEGLQPFWKHFEAIFLQSSFCLGIWFKFEGVDDSNLAVALSELSKRISNFTSTFRCSLIVKKVNSRNTNWITFNQRPIVAKHIHRLNPPFSAIDIELLRRFHIVELIGSMQYQTFPDVVCRYQNAKRNVSTLVWWFHRMTFY